MFRYLKISEPLNRLHSLMDQLFIIFMGRFAGMKCFIPTICLKNNDLTSYIKIQCNPMFECMSSKNVGTINHLCSFMIQFVQYMCRRCAGIECLIYSHNMSEKYWLNISPCREKVHLISFSELTLQCVSR